MYEIPFWSAMCASHALICVSLRCITLAPVIIPVDRSHGLEAFYIALGHVSLIRNYYYYLLLLFQRLNNNLFTSVHFGTDNDKQQHSRVVMRLNIAK